MHPEPIHFFFNDTATTEIYTLSLHDALPISGVPSCRPSNKWRFSCRRAFLPARRRSEEHTSELQSHVNLVCRLLLEKKNKEHNTTYTSVLRRDAVPPDIYSQRIKIDENSLYM